LAGRIGDGLISTSANAEVVQAFAGGSTDRPRYGKASVCWAPTEAQGLETALSIGRRALWLVSSNKRWLSLPSSNRHVRPCACGAGGISINDTKDLQSALDAAFANNGPFVIDAVVDPFEPPMPPKVTREQAVHFAQALLKGEPNREKIILTAISDTVRQIV